MSEFLELSKGQTHPKDPSDFGFLLSYQMVGGRAEAGTTYFYTLNHPTITATLSEPVA